MTTEPIISTVPLGFPWPTLDPFLFCAYHLDHYPEGDDRMGPKASLAGRNIGMDFEVKDGFRMYHGDVVPGFPQHPHRGFETVTLARRGYIDHSDSLGATARFGKGDVQWMTAGKGIVHCEMFPLVNTDKPNPTELFQIWLNLPSNDKMVDPHFTMMWADTIPRPRFTDDQGRTTDVTIVAGSLGDHRGPKPPPSSWAARADADVAIWTISLSPGATFTIPKTKDDTGRTLYFFEGDRVSIGGQAFDEHAAIQVQPDVDLQVAGGDKPVELLLLQGRPIGQPVAHHGPFVMNTRAQLVQAIEDYQRTKFGGWPWDAPGPVHPREKGRFAKHADGRVEERGPDGGSATGRAISA